MIWAAEDEKSILCHLAHLHHLWSNINKCSKRKKMLARGREFCLVKAWGSSSPRASCPSSSSSKYSPTHLTSGSEALTQNFIPSKTISLTYDQRIDTNKPGGSKNKYTFSHPWTTDRKYRDIFGAVFRTLFHFLLLIRHFNNWYLCDITLCHFPFHSHFRIVLSPFACGSC